MRAVWLVRQLTLIRLDFKLGVWRIVFSLWDSVPPSSWHWEGSGDSWPAPSKWCESRSVVSDSLRRLGLYSPQNSPGQNTGVGSLLQGIFPTQGSNPDLRPCGLTLPPEPPGSPEGGLDQSPPFRPAGGAAQVSSLGARGLGSAREARPPPPLSGGRRSPVFAPCVFGVMGAPLLPVPPTSAPGAREGWALLCGHFPTTRRRRRRRREADTGDLALQRGSPRGRDPAARARRVPPS